MRSYLLTLVLLVVMGSAVQAQGPTKMGFQLQAWLADADPAGDVDLFLGGDAAAVSQVVRANGGQVKMAIDGWVQATVPVSAVKTLDKARAVESIVFSFAKGQVLNDSSRVKVHVNEVHEGLYPLPQAYTGKGVLVGIIDTGLELAHPDFQDSLGRTRVLHYWDQNFAYDPWLTPSGYGYGQAWDSTAINAGECPAVDPLNQYGHGSTVAATAAANNNGNGTYAGMAPEADLIIVANALGASNWRSTVVDAVRWILERAAQLDRPVAINLSLGDYSGSHDGLDPAALMIDQMLTALPGRVLVCAAGNSGHMAPYHLRTEVGADTTFTWFAYNPNSAFNMGAVYFDLWADTAAFSQVRYSVGADKATGDHAFRGMIPFRQIQGTLGQVVVDTLWSVDGDKLGRVFTQASLRGEQYHMEVYIPQPDSAGQFYYRFMTTGQGSFDVWSLDAFGTSKMITNVPDTAVYPDIARYVMPDNEQSIVDSWACSPHVITVGNYYNQQVYVDINGNVQDQGGVPGVISVTSSRGPSRLGVVKPDVAAPADVTFGAGPLVVLDALLTHGPEKLVDSLHMRNGGTSIASPVVAGIAALLLEKCPGATHVDVRDLLNQTAFADDFTGDLPNVSFGHGKVNAFQALVASNVEVPLTVDGPLCDGDSVEVSGPDFMSRYWWNTGVLGRDVWTMGAEELSLIVETPIGCKGWSDTLQLEPRPLPEALINADGLLLTGSPGAEHQWYMNGSAIPGAVEQTYEVEENGMYHVWVTDSAGCSAMSDTVAIMTVGVAEVAMGNIRLHPVPVTDRLLVDGLDAAWGLVAYEVVDVQGQVVLRGSLVPGTASIATGPLPTGFYVLRLNGLPGTRNLSFMKE